MKTFEERMSAIDHAVVQRKKKRLRRGIAVLASLAVAVTACNLWLFVPYRQGGMDISAYRDSPYYAVIERLSAINYGSPQKTNNFNELSELISRSANKAEDDLVGGGDVTDDAPASDATEDAYVEVTNNQTEGVIEGDLFKRTQSRLFYLSKRESEHTIWWEQDEKPYFEHEEECVLRAYSIDGARSALLGEYAIRPEEGMTFRGYTTSREMFLSEDGTRVTVLLPCYDRTACVLYTMLAVYDVSDPAAIREQARIYLSGSYLTARVKDGALLVINNFSAYRPDFDKPQSYLPAAGERGALQYVAAEDIVLPEHTQQSRYTVLYLLDEATLSLYDSAAFLSYSNEAYVSAEHIFLTHEGSRTHTQSTDSYELQCSYTTTEIACVDDALRTLTLRGSIEVNGTVNDRFSLDEYEGVLRVFTTTQLLSLSYVYDTPSDPLGSFGEERCNLYCYDLESLKEIASVVDFAPVGESVRSARFDGAHAYVCTAISQEQLLDPVFDFDLSDYHNITWRDTGTITGFSLSLIRFAGDTLLGIGYGESMDDLKIELYRSEGAGVSSVCAYESAATTFPDAFKAYFIDAEQALVGLEVTRPTQDGATEHGFLLLRFDGYSLIEHAFVPCELSIGELRAFVAEGMLYLVDIDGLRVVAL